MFLFLSPDHLVHYTDIGLDDFHHLVADIIGIVGHGDAMVTVFGHLHSEVNRLEQTLGVDTTQDEAGFIQCLGTLGRGADTYG